MILCVAANPSIDKLFEVERVAPGSIHRPAGFVRVPGGKGLNVARAAAALGGDVALVALLAGHAGRWIEEALASEGIARRSLVWADGETRASLSVADGEKGSLTEFYEDGDPIGQGVWAALEDAVTAMLSGGSWMALSGSLPPGAPEDGYARLIGMARECGVRSAIDADGRALRSALSARPDLVKVNVAEARSALSTDGPADGATGARALRDRVGGAGRAAVVTMGAEGAVMAAPDGSVWEGSVEATGRYAVGSGDAFLAGMLVELDGGGDWPQALARGVAAGAANAEVPGAGRLTSARASDLAHSAMVHQI